jgi:hypothetical protein
MWRGAGSRLGRRSPARFSPRTRCLCGHGGGHRLVVGVDGAGDAPAGEEELEHHWHGADPRRFMTHVAMQDADDQGNQVTWAEHVTDEEYDNAASKEGL